MSPSGIEPPATSIETGMKAASRRPKFYTPKLTVQSPHQQKPTNSEDGLANQKLRLANPVSVSVQQ
jgi:hypothetical protein